MPPGNAPLPFTATSDHTHAHPDCIGFLVLPLLAHADCKECFAEWAHALQPGRAVGAANAACKVWPANPAQTLAVLPLPQNGGITDETVYDVELLVADSKTGAVIADSYEPSAITSDAIGLQGIALDTARWRLSPQELAFGVTKTFENSSRLNRFSDTTLSLYVIDGRKLRRVLSNLKTRQSNGDWDGDCTGRFSDISRAISVGPAGRGSYATLVVSANTVDTTNAVVGQECASKHKAARRASFTFEYDGSRYRVPAGLSDDQ